MDTNNNNTNSNTNSGSGVVPLPPSHLPTVPLPSSPEVKKDSVPLPVPSVESPPIPVEVTSDPVDNIPEVVTTPSPLPTAVEPLVSADTPNIEPRVEEAPITEQPVVLPSPNMSVTEPNVDLLPKTQEEPELTTQNPEVVSSPTRKPPVLPTSSVEPVFISGPVKKSKNIKVLFKYLSLILGGFLFIGIILAGYVFIKDMDTPEDVKPTPTPPVVIVQPTTVPEKDNTSLSALETYYTNVNRELKSLEDKTSFENSMNLFGSELR